MKKEITLTAVENGYDFDQAWYIDDELYTTCHCNDSYEIPSILYSLMNDYMIVKVEKLEINSEVIDSLDDEEFPKKLSELKIMITNVKTEKK